MKFIRVAAAGVIGVAAVLSGSAAAISAEVKVMAGNALAGVIRSSARHSSRQLVTSLSRSTD